MAVEPPFVQVMLGHKICEPKMPYETLSSNWRLYCGPENTLCHTPKRPGSHRSTPTVPWWLPEDSKTIFSWQGLYFEAAPRTGWAGWAGLTKGAAAACRNLPCPSAAARRAVRCRVSPLRPGHGSRGGPPRQHREDICASLFIPAARRRHPNDL